MDQTIIFTHLSNNILESIYDTKPKKSDNIELKPSGLWFSKNNEWKEFCDSEDFLKYQHEYRLEIDFENFLIIDTIEKLDDFVKKYFNKKNNCIEWKQIVEKYNGIYFDNYTQVKKYMYEHHKIFNFTYSWFLSVDVNSGCIFKGSSVKSFSLTNSI